MILRVVGNFKLDFILNAEWVRFEQSVSQAELVSDSGDSKIPNLYCFGLFDTHLESFLVNCSSSAPFSLSQLMAFRCYAKLQGYKSSPYYRATDSLLLRSYATN